MAQLKIVYIGGGSTRAPGTIASLLERASGFRGSEVVLVDLDASRLELVVRFARRMAAARQAEVSFEATTDRRRALQDADVVLSAFRPGGFEARVQDERIPLKHDVIGQETQGPGGFFMALRSIAILQEICAEMEELCPRAWIFNYTNPVNIVSQAVSSFSPVPIVSFCEGPILFPRFVAEAAGVDPDLLEAEMVGVNHNCWSTTHRYQGDDFCRLIAENLDELLNRPGLSLLQTRMLRLTAAAGAIPSEYFQYYYFRDEILSELKAKPTTRAEDILARVPDYWAHYAEQAEAAWPELDPQRSRGGIHELELALDAIDSMYNDKGEVLPVNLPNSGQAAAGFDEDLIVELPCKVNRKGFEPISQPRLPAHLRGLVEHLAEYQVATAKAAWKGSRRDAVAALAANPLVMTMAKAEAIYEEMARAHRAYLPERLL
jgi:6-phospho-beta-glucosidase